MEAVAATVAVMEANTIAAAKIEAGKDIGKILLVSGDALRRYDAVSARITPMIHRLSPAEGPVLQTKMAPSSAALQPYVWAYGMTTGRIATAPLIIKLPARPKQLLTFFLEDSYRTLRAGSSEWDAAPRVAVLGPQSRALPGLSIFGRIDQFTIHFQPSGFNRLFGVPMTELTDASYDAHAVIGARFPRVEQELGSAQSFSERIRIIETRLIGLIRDRGSQDPVATAANSLFASHGLHRVSAMVAASGLSTRQFERRFLAQVGMSPKRYARIVRFNAVLDNKLRNPGRVWGRIAHDHDYYDQMHFVRDCWAFTGASPSGFMAHLHGRPEFHPFFATADRPRRD